MYGYLSSPDGQKTEASVAWFLQAAFTSPKYNLFPVLQSKRDSSDPLQLTLSKYTGPVPHPYLELVYARAPAERTKKFITTMYTTIYTFKITFCSKP